MIYRLLYIWTINIYIISLVNLAAKLADVDRVDPLQVIALGWGFPHHICVFLVELLIDQHVLELGGVELYLEWVDREPILNAALSNPQEVRGEGCIVWLLWHVAWLVNRRIAHTHHDVIDSSSILEMPEGKGATSSTPI